MTSIVLEHFADAECIYRGKRATIYRARDKEGNNIVVKTHTKLIGRESDLHFLRKEYEIGKSLSDSIHVVSYLEHVEQSDKEGRPRAMVIMNDCGSNLGKQIPQDGFNMKQFLALAIQCAQGLLDIHKIGITHRDIKPANFIVDETTNVLRYVDFGCASRLREEVEQASTNPNKLYCTLRYMSPEQTGRVNRSIDYRTDFYSLGITFYELVCGHAPFLSRDPMELFHQHVACEPPPLPEHIPTVVQNIISKLLKYAFICTSLTNSKDAAMRYQSCQGLLHDLELCASKLVQTDEQWTIDDFPIAQTDFSERFTISKSKLYGRDKEIETLLSVFECVQRTRKSELLLVSGYSGIGKSSLINEIQRPITMQRSYYITGKFDQLTTVAYGAFVSAFQSLIKQLLAESKERIAVWKEKLLEALHNNGKIIIDIIPELELLIGTQPPVIDLGGQEAKNRFDSVFKSFVSVFTEKAIVIFLDDIQWADHESVQFLKLFLEEKNIVCIAAYRDNEVSDIHPTMVAIEKIRAERLVPVTDIVLAPLSFTDVLQWIHDTLYGSTRDIQKSTELHELSALVHQKTEGNPFFTKIFLQTLHDERLLSLSDDAERWEWDTQKIQTQRATDNVINLTIHRIDQFPPTTSNLLKWACCFGGSVHLSKLVLVLDESITQLKDKLFPALNYGLASIADNELHFAHDRVTETLYMMSSKKERQHMHYTIGHKLITNKDGAMQEFLEAVDHLNKGMQVISDSDAEQHNQFLQLAKYNLHAALIAKKTVAHSATLNYLQVGVECFLTSSPTAWDDEHDLGFTLHKELATAYSVLAEYERSNEIIEELIIHSRNRKESGESYIIRANQYTVQGRILEAYDTAALGLEPFGIKFSSTEPKEERDKRFMEAKQQVQDKMKYLEYDQGSLTKMGTLPPQDEEFSILCNLLMVELPIAYLGMPELLPLTVMVTLNVLLDRQLGPESSMPLIFCAVVLIGMGEYDAAYVYSNLALHIANDVFPEAYSPRSKALHVYTALIHHTREHVHSCENMSRESRRLGVECGEYAFAGYSLTYFVPQLFFTGGNISRAQHELENCCKFVNQTKHEIGKTITVTLQMILDMLEGKHVPNFREHVDTLRQNQHFFAVVHANVFKLVVDYVLDREYEHESNPIDYAYKRFNQIKDIRKELTFVSFLYCVPFFHFYSALYELRLLILLKRHLIQDAIQEEIVSALEEDIKKLETLSKQTPTNYLNKYLLVQAEVAVLEERNWEALSLFSQAIQEAKNQGFMHECAIANERALQFTLYSGKRKLAKGYFTSALRRYRLWGATLKVEQFIEQYPDLMIKRVDGTSQTKVNKIQSSTASYPLAMFDLDSILRASQIISSAIDMDELLLNIMKVIMETAGASKGALIIDELVVAEYINSVALCSKPVEQWNDGCQAIVEFVSRTFDSIVLGDASKDKKYGFIETNPYIISNNIRSVLCMPVIRQNKLKAVLYVENNLMCDAFTSERINVLNVLATQMAISIENSQSFKTKINTMEELAEVQRVRAQEADLYRQKQEEFIDRICHEIRNPIQGIMGNVSMMGLELEQVSGNEQAVSNMRSYVEAVSLCASHQKVITDDVLTLSKLEFEQVKLQPKPFTLTQLCEHVFQMFGAEISKKNLTLTKQVTDGSRVLIGDANRIGQILINLLSNAIKFTERGGISFESRQDFLDKTTVRLEMCVKDTGVGIDERYIKNLFNRFEQITQRTSEYGGSGLGLFISKNLAKLMHGDISCQSIRGQGSAFTFHVKCEYDKSVVIEAKQEEVPTSDSTSDRVLRVLVVEDNKINQRVLQRMIQHIGCECITANDGVEGLEQYINNDLDIVFMDVSMPNMDGYECSRRIREWEQEKGAKPVPIVGLSGNVRQEYHKQGIESGMSEYLNKPISQHDIMEQLRKL